MTGNKLQIESAIATASLIYYLKKKNPSAIRMTYTAFCLQETGCAERLSIVAMNLPHRENFYTLATSQVFGSTHVFPFMGLLVDLPFYHHFVAP